MAASAMRVLIGAAGRGRPQRYQGEIDAVLPAALKDVEFVYDLHDEDDVWDDGIESCDALILTSRGLAAGAVERARRLRFVQKLGSVDDRVDIASCVKRGITVSVLPDTGHVTVAEHTILMILATARNLLQTHRAVVQAENPRGLTPLRTTQNERYSNWLGLPGGEFPLLSDSTLGLIGFGQIAREVAQRARALGMRVIYTKRAPLDAGTERRLGVSFAPLESLLADAHFVSVHATQPDGVPPLIGAREIGRMRKDAVLINTARGNQIDETALVAALKARCIRAAALDVYEFEPALDTELRRLPNVVLTPHTGGLAMPGRRWRDALANVAAVREGRRPTGVIYE